MRRQRVWGWLLFAVLMDVSGGIAVVYRDWFILLLCVCLFLFAVLHAYREVEHR